MNCRQFQYEAGRFPRHDGSTCGPITGTEEECICGCSAYDEFCQFARPAILEDLVAEIKSWHDSAMPDELPYGIKAHLVEEATELRDAPTPEHPSEAVEAADAFICLLMWVMRSKLGLEEFEKAVRLKLEVNRTREWILQEDGSYRHKK